MIVTNKFGVPDVIWKAASNDKYSKGLADVSITGLIDSPQIQTLRSKFSGQLETDVVDRMWSLLGTAVHSLLEGASSDCIVEERLFARVGGLTISGAVDVQEELDDKSIGVMDFKVTACTSVMYGKKSWHQQLNCYAYLIRKNKAKPVKRLQICAILRDWKRSETIRNKDYPKSPIVVVDIPVWSDAEQERYIEERVALHKAALDGEDVQCSKEERWERGEKWAVLKSLKSKRASRTFASEAEAIAFSADSGYIIEHRPGTCTRCEQDYCGVAKWCKQWAAIKNDSKARIPEVESPDDGWL